MPPRGQAQPNERYEPWERPTSKPAMITTRFQTLHIRRQFTTTHPTALVPHKLLTPYDTALYYIMARGFGHTSEFVV